MNSISPVSHSGHMANEDCAVNNNPSPKTEAPKRGMSKLLQAFMEQKQKDRGIEGFSSVEEYLSDLSGKVKVDKHPPVKRPALVAEQPSVMPQQDTESKEVAPVPVFPKGVVPPPPPIGGLADFKPVIRATAAFAPVTSHTEKSREEILKQVKAHAGQQANIADLMVEATGKLALRKLQSIVNDKDVVSDSTIQAFREGNVAEETMATFVETLEEHSPLLDTLRPVETSAERALFDASFKVGEPVTLLFDFSSSEKVVLRKA
ncbi:hypothetical protein QNN88_10095 [Citrobacter sp. ANG330]|uniref:hypothetical protein n=1 Tax=Citrobacter sp. ANG330 TaxID=3048142 RepID=UPI0039C33E8B